MSTVSDIAEGKSPEEAVTIATHSAKCVEFTVEHPIKLVPDLLFELIFSFVYVHGVGYGRYWVLDGLELIVYLLMPVTGRISTLDHATNAYNA